ncbi:hypothetical protein SAMN05216490_2375 [Mucilaginibacter mallensis]|uniref:Uncharacterized protein n=1 Tax=Mucilaginibacter mallensis TaxID=652787 RepID=A0A1H1X6R1_MUCMA|nr:hypothetical protein SAMN05216490_2375 [Mucilaginibacter mallensis]
MIIIKLSVIRAEDGINLKIDTMCENVYNDFTTIKVDWLHDQHVCGFYRHNISCHPLAGGEFSEILKR